MKKLLGTAIFTVAMFGIARAQTYPSPTFQTMTLNSPLSMANGGTGANTAAGALSALGAAPKVSPTFTGTATAPTFNVTGGYEVNGVALSAANLSNGVTGTGSVVLSASPTLTGQATVSGTTLSDPRVSSGVFGPMGLEVGAAGNSNVSLFSATSTNDQGFADAIIALGHIESTAAGASTAPIYAECAMDAPGVCEDEEVDTFNNAGTAYASLAPPNRAFGTTDIVPQGYLASAGSRTGYTGNSWAGYDVESNTALWYVGYYANPAAFVNGGYAFADSYNWFVAANGQMTVNPGTLSTDSAPAAVFASTTSDKSAGGQLQLVNLGSGVATPDKSIRVDGGGNFGVINAGYTAQILTLSDAGSLSTTGGVNSTPVGNSTASTGAFTTLSASGAFTPSGGIVATTTGAMPATGDVGNIVTSNASGVSLTTGVSANITSISLPAGNWYVWGAVAFSPAGTTVTTNVLSGVSTTSGIFMSATPGQYSIDSGTLGTGAPLNLVAVPQPLHLTATTTVYLVGQANFTTSTLTAGGTIYASRMP